MRRTSHAVYTTGRHAFAYEHCYDCGEITLHQRDCCIHCGRRHSVRLPRLEYNPHRSVPSERKRA